jgi:hypothetical protein
LTCKSWQCIGVKFLFRCLYFAEPERMISISALFDSQPLLGRWTRRIHVLTHNVAPLIRQCPNLQILSITGFMSWLTFVSVVDSLTTPCSIPLQTIHWVVSCHLSQVIWALDHLPSLTSICLELHMSTSKHLGAAVNNSNSILNLPNLRQLSLKRNVGEFMKRACGWKMPSLKSISLECDDGQLDIVQFLTHTMVQN